MQLTCKTIIGRSVIVEMLESFVHSDMIELKTRCYVKSGNGNGNQVEEGNEEKTFRQNNRQYSNYH